MTYLSSSIAFRASRYAAIILASAAMGTTLACAESLRGFVYSNEIGNGAHPVGKIELAVGKKIYTVEYGEPVEKHFLGEACNDIGAEWSVTVQRLGGSLYATYLTCTGRVDEGSHKPWLLVWDYLEGLPSSVSRSDVLSSRHLASPEFRRFVELSKL